MSKTIFVICCLLGWGTTAVLAQSGTVTAGGVATGSGGSVTYTIGETNYILATGSGGSVNQGMQQPYEFYVGIPTANFNADVSLFPNPTNEFIVLKIEGKHTENLNYQLFDSDGRLLSGGIMVSNETSIPMKEYANATYFIKVYNSNNESINFKIIKN